MLSLSIPPSVGKCCTCCHPMAAAGIRASPCFAAALTSPLPLDYFSSKLACKKAAERGGYEGERYEKIEFQKKVAEHYYSFRDSTWKVVDGSLPMEIVEEKPRDLATSCIQECQGDPLANLA